MRLLKTLPILLGLGAALGSVSAWALPNDQQQPIRIQADDAQLDDKHGVATYTGDVIITQGSMKVTGNKVTITRTAAGDIDVEQGGVQRRRVGDQGQTVVDRACGADGCAAHVFKDGFKQHGDQGFVLDHQNAATRQRLGHGDLSLWSGTENSALKPSLA